MTNYIDVKATKIQQPGGVFYSFTLDATTLLKIAYVSIEEREKGVQRPLSVKRCKDVAKFIETEKAIFANNIILNLPPEAYFESEVNGGILHIPDEEKTAWIVDGQHRLFGFEYTDKKFDLLCSAFINLDIKSEADIFITINKEQKGISASVIYDLLPLTKNADFLKLRSQSLVREFNEDPDSPWYNEIKMLGVGKGLVSQAAFAKNLEKLINPAAGALAIYNENTQYSILRNYFNAFKSIFFDEWGNRYHILTKTVGLAAMCGVFPKVQLLCNNDLRKSNIMEVLKHAENFDFSSSSRGASSNRVAINAIIQELQEALPNIRPNSDVLI